MLPYQLAPYHHYTIRSMVFSMLLWHEMTKDEDSSKTSFAAASELSANAGVTGWLLKRWLIMLRLALRAAQFEYHTRYDFSRVRFGQTLVERLDEIFGYFAAFSRGPPTSDSLNDATAYFSNATGRFLLGTPSQERRGAR